MIYNIQHPLDITDSIQDKLKILHGNTIQSPLDAIRYADLITKLDKISEELTGLVNNIKEDR